MPTREELRMDPACEARRGIADRIGCRECGEFFPVLSGKNGHLSAEHHLTSDEYSARYVGARLVSFDYYAHSHRGYEAQKLMAKLAEDYATPEVRAECEKDPQYEEKRELEFRICRACGRKSSRVLDRHLAKVHGWTLEQYREKYPGAPVSTPGARRNQMNWLRANPDVMKARNARSHASRQRKLEQIPTLEQLIIEKKEQADTAEQRAHGLRAKKEALEAELASKGDELASVKTQLAALDESHVRAGKAVEDAIPRFELLLSSPELQRDCRILGSYWQHPDFTLEEMDAAREAHSKRTPRKTWAIRAARSFVGTAMQLNAVTVRQYHYRYLKSLQR